MNGIFPILFQINENCCVSKRILKTIKEIKIRNEIKLTNIANTSEKVRITLRNAIFMFLCWVRNFKLVDLNFLIIKNKKVKEHGKERK